MYGSWDMMGKKLAEVKKGSLAAADKIFDGVQPLMVVIEKLYL